MLDTPGFGNFIQEARGALRVADAAIVVVDAVSGVMVQTEKAWGYAEEFQLPATDRRSTEWIATPPASSDRSNRSSRAWAACAFRSRFPRAKRRVQGRGRPDSDEGIHLSDRRLRKIHRVGDSCRHRRARAGISRQAGRSRRGERREADGEVLRQRVAYRRRTDRRSEEAGRRRKDLSRVVLVRCTANIGIQPLLNSILSLLPDAVARGTGHGKGYSGKEVQRKIADNEPFSAFVFKTFSDPFTGRISLFRVYSGTLTTELQPYNVNKSVTERFGSIVLLQGKTQVSVPKLHAGDIAAVAKLKETQTGDTLADKAHQIIYSGREVDRARDLVRDRTEVAR